jgi:hypothetical protein
MANDYIGADESAPSTAGEGMEGSERPDKPDTGMGETTLVPKGMFEGKDLKPGDEFYFTVVAIRGEEVEVSYKHEDEKAEADTETPEGAFDSKFPMMGAEAGGGGGGGY